MARRRTGSTNRLEIDDRYVQGEEPSFLKNAARVTALVGLLGAGAISILDYHDTTACSDEDRALREALYNPELLNLEADGVNRPLMNRSSRSDADQEKYDRHQKAINYRREITTLFNDLTEADFELLRISGDPILIEFYKLKMAPETSQTIQRIRELYTQRASTMTTALAALDTCVDDETFSPIYLGGRFLSLEFGLGYLEDDVEQYSNFLEARVAGEINQSNHYNTISSQAFFELISKVTPIQLATIRRLPGDNQRLLRFFATFEDTSTLATLIATSSSRPEIDIIRERMLYVIESNPEAAPLYCDTPTEQQLAAALGVMAPCQGITSVPDANAAEGSVSTEGSSNHNGTNTPTNEGSSHPTPETL